MTELTTVQNSLKKNEGFAYSNLLDKRKKLYPKFQENDLVRRADLERTFSKSVTTNWSYRLYKITKKIIDTIASYKIDNLKERNNEALLKKTELALKKIESALK